MRMRKRSGVIQGLPKGRELAFVVIDFTAQLLFIEGIF